MSRVPSQSLIAKRRKVIFFLAKVRTDREIAREMNIEYRTVYRLIGTLTKKGVKIVSKKIPDGPGRHYWLAMDVSEAVSLVTPGKERTGHQVKERAARPWFILTNFTGY